MILVLILVSCGGATLPTRECQANTSRLIASNRVPSGDQIGRSAYSGNVTEGIDFLTVRSDSTVDELLAHYNNQTAEQRDNWTLLESGNDGYVAWSSWAVVDECDQAWDGLITISKPPGTTDPFVVIRVRKQD